MSVKNSQIIRVIIPVLNEEKAIPHVINEIPDFVSEVIVVNNGSTDTTKQVATEAGATVIDEPQKGYGKACLTGISYVNNYHPDTDVIVFIDGDYSDFPKEMEQLIQSINEGQDMVIGSRALGNKEKGSMTLPQVFGNWLATFLIKLFYKHSYSDLGPFRAIRLQSLNALGMADEDFGWTVEMQIKALKEGLRVSEIPVSYKNRIGVSKVSGTVKGVIMAGYKIIFTIFKYL